MYLESLNNINKNKWKCVNVNKLWTLINHYCGRIEKDGTWWQQFWILVLLYHTIVTYGYRVEGEFKIAVAKYHQGNTLLDNSVIHKAAGSLVTSHSQKYWWQERLPEAVPPLTALQMEWWNGGIVPGKAGNHEAGDFVNSAVNQISEIRGYDFLKRCTNTKIKDPQK